MRKTLIYTALVLGLGLTLPAMANNNSNQNNNNSNQGNNSSTHTKTVTNTPSGNEVHSVRIYKVEFYGRSLCTDEHLWRFRL